jgi:hypothetical protein
MQERHELAHRLPVGARLELVADRLVRGGVLRARAAYVKKKAAGSL